MHTNTVWQFKALALCFITDKLFNINKSIYDVYLFNILRVCHGGKSEGCKSLISRMTPFILKHSSDDG
jgi:hypothetical protein